MSVGLDVFGEDYLYFYEVWLTDEVSDRQAELLWRLLDLHEGAEVLDLACGHGRIAHRLAARGARVTGLDADDFFLDHARESASGAEFIHGDMRALPWSEPRFDAALLWFTALGYFDEEANAGVLRGVRSVLRDGGRLALDINHLPRLLASFAPQSFLRRGDDFMLDEREWSPRTSLMTTRRTYVRNGRPRDVSFVVRMYMPAELRVLLLEAGFSGVELLNPEGEPLTADDRRVVALARA